MELLMETSKGTSVILDKDLARVVARELISISAVQLNVEKPFTWVSGIKSPVYCDNRRINSFVDARNVVADAFVKLIKNHFSNVEVIAGVATGGIPMGILVAERLNLPFIYVRQAPKDHGLMKQVEGHYKKGSKVVLIEDHVSTGGSSLNAVKGLLDEDLEVLALISIMTYNFKTTKGFFAYHQVNHVSISDLDTILEEAVNIGTLNATEAQRIIEFRDNPDSWSV
jgi:orotate phosphoribosyltransferase